VIGEVYYNTRPRRPTFDQKVFFTCLTTIYVQLILPQTISCHFLDVNCVHDSSPPHSRFHVTCILSTHHYLLTVVPNPQYTDRQLEYVIPTTLKTDTLAPFCWNCTLLVLGLRRCCYVSINSSEHIEKAQNAHPEAGRR